MRHVRFWLKADIVRIGDLCPLMTHSGHEHVAFSRFRHINTHLRENLRKSYVRCSLADEPLYQINHQKQDYRAQRRCDNSTDNASAQY